MDHYDYWADDYLSESLSSKLYAKGYHWFGCYRGVEAKTLLKFLSPEELQELRNNWISKDSILYPFLCDSLPYLGTGI